MHNLLEILILTLRNFIKLPTLRYLGICNVLYLWNIGFRAIPPSEQIKLDEIRYNYSSYHCTLCLSSHPQVDLVPFNTPAEGLRAPSHMPPFLAIAKFLYDHILHTLTEKHYGV